MKQLFKYIVSFTLIIILFSNLNRIRACSCSGGLYANPANRFQSADGVYLIKAEKVYNSIDSETGHYFVDVRVFNKYKGEKINKIKAYGYMGVGVVSCGVYLKEGEYYLIFTDKEGNTHTIGYCSGTVHFEEESKIWGGGIRKNDYSLLLDVIQSLGKHSDFITTKQRFFVDKSIQLIDSLKSFKEPVNAFGLYGITISSEFTTLDVKVLESLDPELDEIVLEYLMESSEIHLVEELVTIKKDLRVREDTTLITGIYFDHKRKEYLWGMVPDLILEKAP